MTQLTRESQSTQRKYLSFEIEKNFKNMKA